MFDTWLWAPSSNLLMVVLSATGVYAAVIIFTRLTGLRSFSKMSAYDFAITVAIGSIIASTLLNEKPTLLQGVVGLATLFFLQKLVGMARRSTEISHLIDNQPILLMRHGQMLHANMHRANVTENDLRARLRAANVTRLAQVYAVVLESTGEMSVMQGDASNTLEEWLLKEVSDPESRE